MDDASLELTIEMADLKELARINPVAWAQLLHIVDNRQNAEIITDLEAHIDKAHDAARVICPHHAEGCPTLAEHRLVTKAELDAKNGRAAETAVQ